MSSQAITTVLIGFGNQGREHFRAIAESPCFRLVAVVDAERSRWQEPLAHGVECAERLHSGFRTVPQAAVIATPPSTYRQLVAECMAIGLDILMEKPFGLCFQDSLDIIANAERHDRLILPAVQRRFQPSYGMVRDHLHMIGELREAVIRIAITHKAGDWRLNHMHAGGGALFDLGFHAIDLAISCFGDVRLLQAAFFDDRGYPFHREIDTRADLLLSTETEAPVRIQIARAAEQKEELIRIRGSAGTLRVTRSWLGFTPAASGEEQCLYSGSADWSIAMQKQLEYYAWAIAKTGPIDALCGPSAWDGARAMRLMEAAYASARAS